MIPVMIPKHNHGALFKQATHNLPRHQEKAYQRRWITASIRDVCHNAPQRIGVYLGR
jgi:hypothetical protein